MQCNQMQFLNASFLSNEMKEFKDDIEKNTKQKEYPNKDAFTSSKTERIKHRNDL
jgi:hypothetical protein